MRAPASSTTLWSDAELADAVDAYVFMLRAQAAGLVYRKETAAVALLEEGLPSRNDASLRYRFRNISAVVQEIGVPVLAGYSPAKQVGTRVRERIRRLLLANPYLAAMLAGKSAESIASVAMAGSPSARSVALDALALLRQRLDEVEREVVGIGHNNPPEPLLAVPPRRAVFDDARISIEALQGKISTGASDKETILRHSEKLLQFGVKMAVWIGQRTTKFADVALATLAPALVVKVTGLLPLIIEAVGAVARAVAH